MSHSEEVENWYKNKKQLEGKSMTKDELILNKIYSMHASKELFILKTKSHNTVMGIMMQKNFDIKYNFSTERYNVSEEYDIIKKINKKYLKLLKMIKDIKLEYIPSDISGEADAVVFSNTELEIEDYEITFESKYNSLEDHVIKAYENHKNKIKKGSNLNVENVIITDIEPEININNSGDTITEKYASIVSNVSQITKDINAGSALVNHKDVVEAFLKAREEISKLTTVKPNRFGFVGKWLIENKVIGQKVDSLKEEQAKNQSTQDNIDFLFGTVYEKYEVLIKTGEGLQKSKFQMKKQIELLEVLSHESDKIVKQYEQMTDVPIRDLSIDTQIKTSIQKYKQRLTKIDGAILATQTTITSLAKDLPSMKNDLTEEMAISSLLGSVDDYQKMYQNIAELVSEVTNATAEKTHVVIENLLQMQIEDTHTMTYLVESSQRAEKLASMLVDKTGKLTKKVQRDATFVADVAKGNSIEDARKNIKLLK